MGKWVYFYIPGNFRSGLGASQCIDAINVHCTRAANTLSTGATKGQCTVNLIFNSNQDIQHHGATGIHINLVCIYTGILAIIWIPSIHLDTAQSSARNISKLFARSYL
jgi:hypothetical protein